MTNSSAEALWAKYTAATGTDTSYTVWAFGAPDDAVLATKLALLVRDGPKRATTSLAAEYDEDDEPLPRAGQHSVVLDGDGVAVCIIRTSAVEIRVFGEVDDQFAWDEGEGDRSLEFWRRVHVEAFSRDGFVVEESTPVVLERFELVWPQDGD